MVRPSRNFLVFALLTAVVLYTCNDRRLQADDWPGWRGVRQDGKSTEINIPLRWSESENVHWKVPLPGSGHSSPIVLKGAIFVTYANAEDLTRHLVRIDRETGETVWDRVITTAPIEPMHLDNTPASTTPVTDGEFVYVSFCDDARLQVAAVDFNGEVAWSVYPGTFEASHGYSTALVIDGNQLFLNGMQDGDDAFLASLNKQTGELQWKVKRARNIRSYSSPCLCEVGDRPAILLSGGEQTIAYDRKTGKTLWEIEGPAEKTVSSIVCNEADKIAYVCGGRDNMFYALDLSATPKAEDRILWRATKGIPYMTSPLVDRGILHIMSDDGVYRCYDAISGNMLTEKRVAGGVKASMVANPERIYIFAVDGTTTVIANKSNFEELANNTLDGSIIASPAISDGDLIIRTTTHLVLVRDKSAGGKLTSARQPPLVNMSLVAELGPGPKKENSGIVKSRQWDDVFWMQNDSGDEPRVYAIHRDGTNYESSRYAETPGVLIGGAINVDWEDITVDSAGHLIVADVGNNGNDRRDMVLYYLNEPTPTAGRTTFLKKFFISYPDQASFPAPKDNFNFDCESVFTVGEQVFFLTKHRSDSKMRLYSLDDPKPEQTNVLTFMDEFDVSGQAVGADATPDGLKLVVVTYDRIWLFERENLTESFFNGKIRTGRYEADQVEAVCFADDQTLLLADEVTARLYSVAISDLPYYSP